MAKAAPFVTCTSSLSDRSDSISDVSALGVEVQLRAEDSDFSSLVLIQHKPSTQVTIRSHLRKHLTLHFGHLQMREIELEEMQRFVLSVKVSSKTAKNPFATMQMLWKSARAWGYVAHDAVSGVVLPKRHRVARRFFSLEEMQCVLGAASGTQIYW